MRKRICIIGPSSGIGGIERASCTLANGFHSLGCEVVYIAIFGHTPFYTLTQGITYDTPGANHSSLSIIPTIRRLNRKIRLYKPDAVIVFNKFYSALAAMALIGIDVPFYISERSSPLYRWPLKIRFFNRIAFYLKRPDGVIAQTSIAKHYQRKYYSKKTRIGVFANPVRNIRFNINGIRENSILAVGRLADPLKGFDRLIEAYALAKVNWPLLIAGSEEGADNIKQLVHKHNLTGHVRFLGKRNDIDNLYARSKIFILSSRSEGFPNALAEAMISGMACISFDFIAGPSDMIQHNINGILIKDGDINSMANSIQNLVNNPRLVDKLGEQAVKLCEKLNEQKITLGLLTFIFPDSLDGQ